MDKLKWMCDYNNNPCDGTKLSFEKDRAFGFSWPQRNYGCSFCKKEFKSAQALGGHMNVHRRDRARLRQLSPNPNPNPHPTFVLPSTPMFVPYMPCHSSLTAVINSSEEKVVPPLDLMENIDFASTKEARVWKANECIRLDLNLNLFQDAKDQDLDLELRLGSS